MLVSYNMCVCILEFGWQCPDLDRNPHQAHMSDNDEVESLEASPIESLDGDSAAPGAKTDNGELPALDCKSKREQKQAKYLQEAAKDQQKAARQERNPAREQLKAIREQQKAAREQQKAATEKMKAAAYKLKAEQRTIAADERAGPDFDSHPHIPEKCMATARQLFAALKARCAGMVMAVEIFAGCARLSGAMIEQSVSLFVPIDKNNGPWADISNPFVAAVLCLPSKRAYSGTFTSALSARCGPTLVHGAHLRVPWMLSVSRLQCCEGSNGASTGATKYGSPLRTHCLPSCSI